MWGWLIAVAVVARLIYVAAGKEDRAKAVGPSQPSPVTKKPGCLAIIPIFFGITLGLYGFFGLLQGQPGVFVIAMVLLSLGWLLVKKS